MTKQKNADSSTLIKRIIMTVLGVSICGFSVGFFRMAAMGVDPFQTFMSGLDRLIPISFGTLYVIANIVLLMFSLVFCRKNIGLGTLINLFLLGYIVQFSDDLLRSIFPEPSLGLRILFLIIGIVVMCFSSALYFTADLGVSTYDSVALIMTYTWNWGKFQYIRIATDLCCVVLGSALYLLAGGTWKEIPTIAGIGTIVTAFFMGPLIEYFNVHVARPFLYGKNGKS
ncbi:MAG: hypothetical protein HUJ72_02975 [Blautia sp.]|nr:hypothetical protein [Blautia sp.]